MTAPTDWLRIDRYLRVLKKMKVIKDSDWKFRDLCRIIERS